MWPSNGLTLAGGGGWEEGPLLDFDLHGLESHQLDLWVSRTLTSEPSWRSSQLFSCHGSRTRANRSPLWERPSQVLQSTTKTPSYYVWYWIPVYCGTAACLAVGFISSGL